MTISATTISPAGGDGTFIFTNGAWAPQRFTWIVDVEVCTNSIEEIPRLLPALTNQASLPVQIALISCDLVLPPEDVDEIEFGVVRACKTWRYTFAVTPLSPAQLGGQDEGYIIETWKDNMGESAQARFSGHYRGHNPDNGSLSGALGSDAMRAICWKESTWRQFTGSGEPLKNANSNGTIDWGCMQINQASGDQIWDWRANVSGAQAIFAQKQTYAKSYLDAHTPYSPDMLLRETIQRYNGGTYYNWNDVAKKWEAHPHNGYADSVLAIVAAHPWP